MIPDSDFMLSGSRELEYANGKKLGVRIQVAIHRPLDQNELNELDRFTERFLRFVQANDVRNNPDLPARKESVRQEIETFFNAAGLSPFYMAEIENGYCKEPCCFGKPWFVVTSRIGPITIGHRKRVFNIDWSGSAVKNTADELFPDTDVTKGPHFIHAWAESTVIHFLKVLAESAG